MSFSVCALFIGVLVSMCLFMYVCKLPTYYTFLIYYLRSLVVVIVDVVQLMLYLMCHPIWDVRKFAHEASKKIITAAPQLSEALLLEYINFLSIVGEKITLLKRR